MLLTRGLLFVLIFCISAGAETRRGLVASYSDGAARVRIVVPAPNFYLDAAESLHPSLRASLSAEWTGEITVLQAGDYSFRTGAATLTINGVRYAGRPVPLGPGHHAIRLQYRRVPGIAALRFEWQSNHFPYEPVPISAFTHSSDAGPSREEGLAERGRELVQELGCVNCHASQSPQLVAHPGPDLADAGWRLNPSWVYKWLDNPKAFRAGAAMPSTANAEHRRDIAAYLATVRSQRTQPRVRAPRPLDIAKGAELFGSIGCAACHRREDGLALDGLGSKTQLWDLSQFLADPAKFDPSGRMPSMLLTREEPFHLAAYLLESRNAEFEQRPPAGDAERGKALVESEGCLACHSLPQLSNTQRAPELAKLDSSRGCLAATPAATVPLYRLADHQRAAIREFLSAYRKQPDVSTAPIYKLNTSLRQMRCMNCHPSDSGAALVSLNEAAPSLDDIGAKLRSSWIARVVTGKQRSRKYLALRMPHYDVRHAAGLETALAKASGLAPGDGPPAPVATAAVQERGAGMIGTDPRKGGMGCVGCHDWGEYRSLGEEGPQLIDVTERLRHDWYTRWMHNPARILSGTSMPNYFSAMEPVRAGEMIGALWAGMSLGAKMPLPAGLGRVEASMDAEARPVPDKEAIVVRWDMPEATPAAIAVGLPGGLSYCFDAGESRLRYAWSGGFLDLTETLSRKTDEKKMTPTAKLVGEVFYRSPSFPFRVGAPDRVPQRRFLGYRIVDGAPEFRYRIDGIEVLERVARGASGSLVRTISVAQSDQPMWFLEPQLRQLPRGPVKFEVPVRKEGQ